MAVTYSLSIVVIADRVVADIRDSSTAVSAAQTKFNALTADRAAAESRIELFQRQMEFNNSDYFNVVGTTFNGG